MSPEQMSGDQQLDGRSDQYALGCVLYEMLAGEPPHQGPNLAAIVAKMMAGPAQSVRMLRSDVPEAVERALGVALERKPEDRHATVAEFGAALAGTAPPTPKRRWAKWAATVAVTAVITLAWYIGATRSSSLGMGGGEELNPNLVAVLPFTARVSEEPTLWEEGMATLLATALDGAGELATVNSHAVLGFLERTSPGELDPEIGREIAAHLGAGRFIVGDVLEAGGRISVRAFLYGVDGELEATADADVADEEQIQELVLEVGRQLVQGHAGISGDQLTRIGAATTHSLTALKAYLRGEALFRSGFYNPAGARSALAEYRQAVDADTAFALAYLRMALIQDYALSFIDVGDAAARARRFSDRLPPQERRLLECYSALQRADGGEAERWCREVTKFDESNADAWYLLGDALQHYGLRRGRAIDEVRAAYDRALALEPSHLYRLRG
jgi:serine/threonine-protein kinase